MMQPRLATVPAEGGAGGCGTTMTQSIAIVGMACEYPDARTPAELWENVLARRQAFRRIPTERLNLNDYFDAQPNVSDRIYSTQAAVIRDYEFDRVRFRVSGDTHRACDPVHWLALDVADRALHDAGFPNGSGLPRDSTGVFLGNTLTARFLACPECCDYVGLTFDARSKRS